MSERTTCDELIRLVLLCNNINDNVNNYSIYEVSWFNPRVLDVKFSYDSFFITVLISRHSVNHELLLAYALNFNPLPLLLNDSLINLSGEEDGRARTQTPSGRAAFASHVPLGNT